MLRAIRSVQGETGVGGGCLADTTHARLAFGTRMTEGIWRKALLGNGLQIFNRSQFSSKIRQAT